ncbi:MAG: hypothetical protein JJE19_00915 [Methanosarcinales archaeon]|nr:hypothetical protein [Methanosarcinales archaeon]
MDPITNIRAISLRAEEYLEKGIEERKSQIKKFEDVVKLELYKLPLQSEGKKRRGEIVKLIEQLRGLEYQPGEFEATVRQICAKIETIHSVDMGGK